jgi:hypothetical protein
VWRAPQSPSQRALAALTIALTAIVTATACSQTAQRATPPVSPPIANELPPLRDSRLKITAIVDGEPDPSMEIDVKLVDAERVLGHVTVPFEHSRLEIDLPYARDELHDANNPHLDARVVDRARTQFAALVEPVPTDLDQLAPIELVLTPTA